MFNVKKMKSAGSHKDENLAFLLALPCNVDKELSAPQETMWPNVLVLQDCSPVIPMAKVANKSTVLRMMIAQVISIVTDCLTLA